MIFRKKKNYKPSKEKKKAYNKKWKASNPASGILSRSKARASKKGLEFNLTIEDIVIPEVCPYLKIPINTDRMYSPSLDRIDNNKGYIKGNVEVISWKANIMKSNASPEELVEFAKAILEKFQRKV